MKLFIFLSNIIAFIIGMSVSLNIIMCSTLLNEYNENYCTTEDTLIIDTVPCFYSMHPSEGLYEALLHYDIKHPEIVYAQAILETGHFKSKVYNKTNNLFGLYDSANNTYYSFEHWTESVVAYKDYIQYKYKPPDDYYSFLEKINYAEDPMYISKLKTIVNNGKIKQNASTSYH